jgi:hypothetical protein
MSIKINRLEEGHNRAFNFTYRYINDVLSINNSKFAEFLPLIYPPETTDTASSASFLDLYLEFDIFPIWKCIAYNRFCRDGIYFDKILVSEYLRDRIRRIFFQTCAAIYQLLLHMVFTPRNWFAMQGPVAIILISWNVIFISETGYWTRAIKRFALFDLLKSLYSDTSRRSWYIATHVWKIYDFKIEVIPFIINFSTELTTVVKFEI